MTHKIIGTDEKSIELLAEIFNSENSPEECRNYGNGKHCNNEERLQLKKTIWGPRGDDALAALKEDPEAQLPCAIARVAGGDTPVLYNNGFTGRNPTVLDRSNGDKSLVHEAGFFFSDAFSASSDSNKITVMSEVNKALASCKPAEGHTLVFVTTSHLGEYFLKSGATEINEDNYIHYLGENSFHPERFRFDENGKIQECTDTNKDVTVSHEGWHDSNPCISWTDKDAFIFTITGDSIDIDHSEL